MEVCHGGVTCTCFDVQNNVVLGNTTSYHCNNQVTHRTAVNANADTHPHRRMNTDEVIGLLPRGHTASTNAEAVIPCRYDQSRCKTAGTDDTLGYCNKHFTLLYNDGRVQIPTVHAINRYRENRRAQPSSLPATSSNDIIESYADDVTSAVKKCRSPLCYSNRLRTGKEFCVDCEAILSRQHKYPPEQLERKSVVCPGCNRRGLTTNNGLCHNCLTSLTTQHTRRLPVPQPDSIISAHRSRAIPTGSPVKYSSHKPNRPSSNAPPVYPKDDNAVYSSGSKALDDPVELSWKPDSGVRLCNSGNCKNYGNAACVGYCNECFSRS